ncbi:amidohydrolase [Stackebrandtia albiflava]|uniref:Amidohydrolase n=1 Tax=Stackebrandtia albiflava TaxID=406432 RepID=A0A562V4C0_9ACTN|nr:amidohydrolase [Stackebrandtia albiflava]TWJ12734.1 amidohydrolase [Stackebrandtia albiflava]
MYVEPGPSGREAGSSDPLSGVLDGWLQTHEAELIGVRRHLHAHPELSGFEQGTANHIAERLRAAGLEPRLIPGGNGVLCDIGDSEDGRIVALRADMDALPITDPKDVPYRSTVEGVCHACGHDVHTTVLLGTGLMLAELHRRGQLPGRVRLVFQPSEEKFPSGAPVMMRAGALDDVSAIYAFHCDPKLPCGMIGVRSGPLTAASDMLEVQLRGRGGHTSRPHLTTDLVHALSRVVVDVPALLDRRLDPRTGCALVFGAINAGSAANAIPQEGSVRGTVRMLDRDAWKTVPDMVTQIIEDVVRATGAQAEVTYTRGVPPVVNDRVATAVFAGAAAAALGESAVVEAPVSMGGEDFSWYLEQVPGAMARLGVGRPGEQLDLHQGDFDVDERAIANGVRVLVHTALAACGSAAY